MKPGMRRLQAVGIAVIAAGLMTGCGLKQAQLDQLKQAAANPAVSTGQVDGTDGGFVTPGGDTGATPTPGATSGTGTTDPGTTTPGTPTTGTTDPGTTTPGGGSTPTTAASGPCSTPIGGNTTGISSRGISIGVHAPQTGTGAPLPPSFADGVQVFWNQADKKICGRKVTVDFQDDKYTPATATAVCGPMSRRDFLIIGAAGTDQIQACATMPDIQRSQTPYMSAGVTTNGLNSLKNYFAFSLTYQQQGRLVVKNAEMRGYAHPKGAGGKWAIVMGTSANFNDATKGMEDALREKGIPFDTYRINQTSDNGLQQRAISTGSTLRAKGYDVVATAMSPGYFLYMTTGASKQGYNPQYTGPGVTMTEVTVAQLVCTGTVGVIRANFLAPFPGIDRVTPDFVKATGGQYDDIYWALWGQAQLTYQTLMNANDNLTREHYIEKTLAGSFAGGAFAPARFAGSHYGGTGVYSQVMNCKKTQPNQGQQGSWDTVGSRINL